MKRLLRVPVGKAGFVIVFASIVLTSWSSFGVIIPANRLINWDPGIPGGIPNRSNIFTTLTGIDNTGATDVRAAIQSALNSCPANQVVKLPVGTFRVNGGITIPSNVTLRGSGSNTIITSMGSTASLFQFGTGGVQWDPTSISSAITGGNTAGSTSINVLSSSGISVGGYLVISELNDPAYVSIDGTLNGAATWVDSWNSAGQRARGQIVEVTSVSGNTIGITPGLYSAYTRTPWATRFNASCKWAGVEDLKTYANNTGTSRNFFFQTAAYCWVKNVESDYTDGDHCTLDWSYRCEVRHNYFHDSYVHTSGSFDNMIGLRTKTTACLVIDNITRRLHCGIMLEWGAAGNVIAYNYDEGGFDQNAATGARWLPPSINSNHGAHPQFNLFEGNFGQKFQADAYWGSSSHQTVFRNYFSGTGVAHPPYTGRGVEDTGTTAVLIQANRAMDVWEIQPTHSIVGNVIGSPALVSRNVVRKVVNPQSRAYDNPPYCFSYGYTSESGGGGAALENPTLTVIEHGNYDVASGGIVWDPNISDHNLPASLFLSSKPAWFGSLPWPPVNPANPSFSPTNIPAGYRWVYKRDPATGPVNNAPTAVASGNPTSGVAPLSVTFSSLGSSDPEGTALTYNWTFGDSGTSTAANPGHTYTVDGNYSARVTVSDGTNTTASSLINITVRVAGSNYPPVVAASASPTNGLVPLTVTFSSAGSSDVEGTPLTYNWSFGDGGTSTDANPSYTYPTNGNFVARLTVSDGTNSVQSGPIAISVLNPGSGLVAAYGFEESVGSTVRDSSGNNNIGALSAATRTAGKNGQGLSFDGSSALVSVADSPTLDLSGSLTIEAWVNPASTVATWKPIVFKAIDASQISYVLQGASSPSGAPSLGLSVSGSNLMGTAALPANTWSHIAATYDGATMRLYVNGAQVASRAQSGGLGLSTQPLTIGGNALFSAYWNGLVDDVRIYNRALTVTEIQADMNTAVPAATSPLPPPADLRIVNP